MIKHLLKLLVKGKIKTGSGDPRENNYSGLGVGIRVLGKYLYIGIFL